MVLKNFLFGVSFSSVLAIMPAMSDDSEIVDETVRLVLLEGDASVSNKNYTGINSSEIYGGAINNSGTLSLTDVLFNGNSSAKHGGAIMNLNTIVVNGSTEFNGNYVMEGEYSGGGAIYNEGDITFNGITIFDGTLESENGYNAMFGGAINNDSSGHSGLETATITFNEVVKFLNNTASVQGGAVLNSANDMIVFNQGVIFSGNTAQQNGNMVINSGTMVFNGGLEMQSNGNAEDHADNNSGFDNMGTVTVVGGNILVKNNVAGAGAGFSNSGTLLLGAYFDEEGEIQIQPVQSITFTNNHAVGNQDGENGSAGALYAGGRTQLYANTITFDGNSNSNRNNGSSYGGAIALQGGILDIIGDMNLFTNNYSYSTTTIEEKLVKFGGGAIQNRGNTTPSNITIGKAGAINVFESNTSAMHGGAIHARAEAETDVGNISITGTTGFNSNQAVLNGGAISNMPLLGQSTFTFNGDTNFQNNIAGGNGGAIYNTGDMTFNGNVTFSGNKSGATFTFDEDTGAITGYSNGTANDIYNNGTINFNGNVTLDGGITGAGTIVLANGKFLNIGNASISQGAINMNGGTIVAMISNVDDEYRINVGDFSGDGTIALTLGDVGTYKIFGESSFSGHTIFEGNITFDSPIYHLEWIDNNSTITAARKTAEQIANDNEVSIDAARTILNLMDSSSDVLNDLGMSLQEQLAVKNRNAVEHAHHAIHPEMESVVQSVSTSVQTAIAKLAAGRMAIVQSSVGRSGGDVATRGGVWAEGMYNKSKQNDAFNGYTRGVTVGIDTKLGRGFMLGAGYSYARSDFSGTVRDTDVGSNTVFVYGQYKPTAWYMNAMLNYTMSDYVEKSDVLGTLVESDYDVNAFGGAIMTGYDFAGGITPEMGVRYMHISADEYKNSLDIKSKLDDVDYLTGMLGAKYAFDYRVSRGFTLRPELRGAAKFDVISDENVATINMPGINSYVLNGNRLSRMGVEFGAGIAMKYNDFSLALNYDIELREDYTSQTGRVRARYVF